MNHDWLEMRIVVPPEAAELLGQALLDLGCSGINVHEQPLDTFDVPDEIPLSGEEIIARAYFPETSDVEALRTRILLCLEELTPFFPRLMPSLPECHTLPTEDWATCWQQHFSPFQVGDRLVIQPSWVESFPDKKKQVLTLDPGRAFGTGTHATTGLCLDVIARLAEKGSTLGQVLDVGTGSGILALAAATLGARHVLACDIDPEARQVARDNVQQNGLADQVSVTDHSLAEITGQFDLVLANILAKENIRLGPAFLQRMAPQSILVLSGILVEQEADVIAAFRSKPVTLVATAHKEGWSCLTFRRND